MQTTDALTNPLNLPIIDAAGYETGQGYDDAENVAEIAASMSENGWVGAPLVVLPDYARSYTGSHRLKAASLTGTQVPGVDLTDMFEACGLDLWQIVADEDLDILHDRAAVLAHLPADVLAAYTLDDIED